MVNAKAGCLYPNNARMLTEVRGKGFGNALVADAMGNVAETRHRQRLHGQRRRGVHPHRQRHLPVRHHPRAAYRQPAADGVTVHETVLTFDDFRGADEVFLSGNMSKVTPVTAFEDRQYQVGPVTRQRARYVLGLGRQHCA